MSCATLPSNKEHLFPVSSSSPSSPNRTSPQASVNTGTGPTTPLSNKNQGKLRKRNSLDMPALLLLAGNASSSSQNNNNGVNGDVASSTKPLRKNGSGSFGLRRRYSFESFELKQGSSSGSWLKFSPAVPALPPKPLLCKRLSCRVLPTVTTLEPIPPSPTAADDEERASPTRENHDEDVDSIKVSASLASSTRSSYGSCTSITAPSADDNEIIGGSCASPSSGSSKEKIFRVSPSLGSKSGATSESGNVHGNQDNDDNDGQDNEESSENEDERDDVDDNEMENNGSVSFETLMKSPKECLNFLLDELFYESVLAAKYAKSGASWLAHSYSSYCEKVVINNTYERKLLLPSSLSPISALNFVRNYYETTNITNNAHLQNLLSVLTRLKDNGKSIFPERRSGPLSLFSFRGEGEPEKQNKDQMTNCTGVNDDSEKQNHSVTSATSPFARFTKSFISPLQSSSFVQNASLFAVAIALILLLTMVLFLPATTSGIDRGAEQGRHSELDEISAAAARLSQDNCPDENDRSRRRCCRVQHRKECCLPSRSPPSSSVLTPLVLLGRQEPHGVSLANDYLDDCADGEKIHSEEQVLIMKEHQQQHSISSSSSRTNSHYDANLNQKSYDASTTTTTRKLRRSQLTTTTTVDEHRELKPAEELDLMVGLEQHEEEHTRTTQQEGRNELLKEPPLSPLAQLDRQEQAAWFVLSVLFTILSSSCCLTLFLVYLNKAYNWVEWRPFGSDSSSNPACFTANADNKWTSSSGQCDQSCVKCVKSEGGGNYCGKDKDSCAACVTRRNTDHSGVNSGLTEGYQNTPATSSDPGRRIITRRAGLASRQHHPIQRDDQYCQQSGSGCTSPNDFGGATTQTTAIPSSNLHNKTTFPGTTHQTRGSPTTLRKEAGGERRKHGKCFGLTVTSSAQSKSNRARSNNNIGTTVSTCSFCNGRRGTGDVSGEQTRHQNSLRCPSSSSYCCSNCSCNVSGGYCGEVAKSVDYDTKRNANSVQRNKNEQCYYNSRHKRQLYSTGRRTPPSSQVGEVEAQKEASVPSTTTFSLSSPAAAVAPVRSCYSCFYPGCQFNGINSSNHFSYSRSLTAQESVPQQERREKSHYFLDKFSQPEKVLFPIFWTALLVDFNFPNWSALLHGAVVGLSIKLLNCYHHYTYFAKFWDNEPSFLTTPQNKEVRSTRKKAKSGRSAGRTFSLGNSATSQGRKGAEGSLGKPKEFGNSNDSDTSCSLLGITTVRPAKGAHQESELKNECHHHQKAFCQCAHHHHLCEKIPIWSGGPTHVSEVECRYYSPCVSKNPPDLVAGSERENEIAGSGGSATPPLPSSNAAGNREKADLLRDSSKITVALWLYLIVIRRLCLSSFLIYSSNSATSAWWPLSSSTASPTTWFSLPVLVSIHFLSIVGLLFGQLCVETLSRRKYHERIINPHHPPQNYCCSCCYCFCGFLCTGSANNRRARQDDEKDEDDDHHQPGADNNRATCFSSSSSTSSYSASFGIAGGNQAPDKHHPRPDHHHQPPPASDEYFIPNKSLHQSHNKAPRTILRREVRNEKVRDEQPERCCSSSQYTSRKIPPHNKASILLHNNEQHHDKENNNNNEQVEARSCRPIIVKGRRQLATKENYCSFSKNWKDDQDDKIGVVGGKDSSTSFSSSSSNTRGIGSQARTLRNTNSLLLLRPDGEEAQEQQQRRKSDSSVIGDWSTNNNNPINRTRKRITFFLDEKKGDTDKRDNIGGILDNPSAAQWSENGNNNLNKKTVQNSSRHQSHPIREETDNLKETNNKIGHSGIKWSNNFNEKVENGETSEKKSSSKKETNKTKTRSQLLRTSVEKSIGSFQTSPTALTEDSGINGVASCSSSSSSSSSDDDDDDEEDSGSTQLGSLSKSSSCGSLVLPSEESLFHPEDDFPYEEESAHFPTGDQKTDDSDVGRSSSQVAIVLDSLELNDNNNNNHGSNTSNTSNDDSGIGSEKVNTVTSEVLDNINANNNNNDCLVVPFDLNTEIDKSDPKNVDNGRIVPLRKSISVIITDTSVTEGGDVLLEEFRKSNLVRHHSVDSLQQQPRIPSPSPAAYLMNCTGFSKGSSSGSSTGAGSSSSAKFKQQNENTIHRRGSLTTTVTTTRPPTPPPASIKGSIFSSGGVGSREHRKSLGSLHHHKFTAPSKSCASSKKDENNGDNVILVDHLQNDTEDDDDGDNLLPATAPPASTSARNVATASILIPPSKSEPELAPHLQNAENCISSSSPPPTPPKQLPPRQPGFLQLAPSSSPTPQQPGTTVSTPNSCSSSTKRLLRSGSNQCFGVNSSTSSSPILHVQQSSTPPQQVLNNHQLQQGSIEKYLSNKMRRTSLPAALPAQRTAVHHVSFEMFILRLSFFF